MNSILISIVTIVTLCTTWCILCLRMYRNRSNEVIIVDFDSAIADMNVILKRAKLYEQNNPNNKIDDYISAHINEQQPIESGIKRVWDFQQKKYKIVFITNRKESLRLETANFLNKWGLSGELYMQDFGDIGVVEKIWLIQMYREKKFKVVGLLDWSSDALSVSQSIDVRLI